MKQQQRKKLASKLSIRLSAVQPSKWRLPSHQNQQPFVCRMHPHVRPSVCSFFSVQSGCYPSSQIVGHGFHGFTLLFSTDFVLAATNITGRSVNRYLSSAAAQHVLVGVAIRL